MVKTFFKNAMPRAKSLIGAIPYATTSQVVTVNVGESVGGGGGGDVTPPAAITLADLTDVDTRYRVIGNNVLEYDVGANTYYVVPMPTSSEPSSPSTVKWADIVDKPSNIVYSGVKSSDDVRVQSLTDALHLSDEGLPEIVADNGNGTLGVIGGLSVTGGVDIRADNNTRKVMSTKDIGSLLAFYGYSGKPMIILQEDDDNLDLRGYEISIRAESLLALNGDVKINGRLMYSLPTKSGEAEKIDLLEEIRQLRAELEFFKIEIENLKLNKQ